MLNESVSPDKFDWTLYEDWDGCSLRENKHVKKHDDDLDTVIYCHEPYAQEAYEAYYAYDHGRPTPVVDIRADELYGVEDIKHATKNSVIVSLTGGAVDIEVDLTKEGRFFDAFYQMYGLKYDKESFIEMVEDDFKKQEFLGCGINVVVNSTKTKASLWDGYVRAFKNELYAQTKLQNIAYIAHVDSANNGGYFVTVNGCVSAFMPGSMAASNKVVDFEALLGKDLYVMIANYDNKYGFVVSHKKYLQAIAPKRISELKEDLKKDPNTWFEGTVTGYTKFGVFVELDDVLTGMIHYTLYSKDLKKRVENHEVNAGDKIKVRVDRFEGNRIILTDTEPVIDVSKVAAKLNTKEEQ